MKKVIVIGARGMLGHAVHRFFSLKGYDAVALSRSEFDIAKDSPTKLEPVLERADAVINCAGVIKPLIATTSIEDVLRVNAIFPRNLAKLTEARKIPMVHVTTDCVYSGKRGGYDESDLFDAEDVYGLSKNAGDAADCMVLRTSIIGEERGQSRSLLEWARSQKGKEVNGFTNHRWNGVTTVQLAEGIEHILTRGLHQRGIFHVFSPDTVTKAELLKVISDAYDFQLKVKPVEAKDFCDRSLKSLHGLSRQVFTKPLSQQLSEMRKLFSA
jgi:dTDP-4-dehydrorhamnose reductase